MEAGKALGSKLKELLYVVLDKPEYNTKEKLLALVRGETDTRV